MEETAGFGIISAAGKHIGICDIARNARLAEDIVGILFHNSTGFIAQSSYTAQPIEVVIIYSIAIGNVNHHYRLIDSRAALNKLTADFATYSETELLAGSAG